MSKLPGRNDPCHCGSGLKYKKCHESSDRAAASAPHLRLLNNAAPSARQRLLTLPEGGVSAAWEATVAPLPGVFDDDPQARPVILMVVANGFVVSTEIVNRPSEEPDVLASLLAREILVAAQKSGVVPTHISIRHAALHEPLSRLLDTHGFAVRLASELPGIDDALRSMLGHVFGGIAPLNALRSQPETWAGWGMPSELVARMFSAAADFFRAAPWETSMHERPVLVSRSGGHEWACVILGAAGKQLGFACYHDPDDLTRMHEGPGEDVGTAFDAMHGTVVSVLFDRPAELPKRMREEIKRARWDVASPDAYPALLVLNTPGGGIRQQYFEDVLGALESVPKFVARHAAELSDEYAEEIRWTDEQTGVTCRLEPLDLFFGDLLSLHEALQLCGPMGQGAKPRATVTESTAAKEVAHTLSYFIEWLRSVGDKPLSDSTIAKHVVNTRFFVELCAYGSSRPIRAVTEYDLRSFVHDWYPRVAAKSESGVRSMLVSLRRFFTFLRELEQVECPWAWPVLDDTHAAVERWRSCPKAHFWDERVQDWRMAHMMDLEARVLIPVDDRSGGFAWSDAMGAVEQRVYTELRSLWLRWRDEVVRKGVVVPADVLERVLQRQRKWMSTPAARSGGLSPAQEIERERNSGS